MPEVNIPDALVEPCNKLLVPVSTSAGKTLQDIWDLVFGGFGIFVEKTRLTRQRALTEFKTSLESKVASIPADHLCEPRLSVIGPALEASKYYFEEQNLREMFSSLVASAVDCEKAPRVRSSFVEMIKQLSPLDAQNLMYFYPKPLRVAIAEYQIKHEDGSLDIMQKNVFIANPRRHSLAEASTSIENLARLGIIEFDYSYISNPRDYDAFSHTSEYQKLVDTCSNNMTPIIKTGVAMMTQLGEDFCSICLSA